MNRLHLAIDGQCLNCLVIGGGQAAAIKLHTLTEAHCQPTILAPTLIPQIAKLIETHELTHIVAPYSTDILRHQPWHLVIIATDSYSLNDAIALDCQQAHVLYILTSDATRSPVHSPATTHRHGLSISVYAHGLPILSRRLRDHYLSLLPPESAQQIEQMHQIRRQICLNHPPNDTRRRIIRQQLTPLIDRYLQGLD